eukprot:1452579-Amphidinium_carterae.1
MSTHCALQGCNVKSSLLAKSVTCLSGVSLLFVEIPIGWSDLAVTALSTLWTVVHVPSGSPLWVRLSDGTTHSQQFRLGWCVVAVVSVGCVSTAGLPTATDAASR